MRSKAVIKNSIFFLVVLLLGGTSCKKKKAFKNENGQASVEVHNARSEEAIVLVDINQALAGQWMIRGRSAAVSASLFGTTCGLVTDTSMASQGIITLTYDGTVCDTRKRSGSITLTVENYPANTLKTAGSRVRVDFKAYKVTRNAYGGSLQMDGTLYITNESGGTWYDLAFLNQPALIELITAQNLKMTLNGDAEVLYTITRRITYTHANSVTTCAEDGAGTHNGKSGVETWGYTQDKIEFTSHVTSPVLWSTVCGPFFPLGGEVGIQVVDKSFELKCLYGLDASGAGFSPSGNNCPYGWKTSWTYKSSTKSRLFNYTN